MCLTQDKVGIVSHQTLFFVLRKSDRKLFILMGKDKSCAFLLALANSTASNSKTVAREKFAVLQTIAHNQLNKLVQSRTFYAVL